MERSAGHGHATHGRLIISNVTRLTFNLHRELKTQFHTPKHNTPKL